MRRLSLMSLVFCGIASMAPTADAGITFSLSSPQNLSALTVGQAVEVDVNIAGLPSPNSTDFIFNLNTKVVFSSSLFQIVRDPTSTSGLTATVTPGSVFYNNVQGPLQIANFNAQSSFNPGVAIGDFSESPNTNSGAIGLNGVYYSFLLKANSVGSGTINFDLSNPANNQYAANETGNNFAPLNITTGFLSFTINPAAVPEPSSLAMVALGVAAVGVWTRKRGRSAA